MIIRDAKPEDLAWIYMTWIGGPPDPDSGRQEHGYRHHTKDKRVQQCPWGEYYPRWRQLTGRLLSVSRVIVAAHQADLSVVCGWLCWQPGPPPRIHYLHVRRRMRRLGVATALLEHAKINRTDLVLYSHRTDASDALVPDAWLYRPWLLIGV